jgi:UDP-N-acetyl-2-amino-2-deoxyglucuronate dehydrogenase
VVAGKQVALVGCGWAGRRHAAAYRELGVEVGWAVDVDAARAGAFVDEGLARAPAADLVPVLRHDRVLAVDVCLPHDLHHAAAIAAARAGKAVLVEKPLADTLEHADAMIAAAEQAGVVLMVAENVRFEPLYARIRQLLDQGAIGQPALVQLTREAYLRESFMRDRPWFLDARRAAGGIMMSGGVHDFELLRMLLGEVASVQALRARQRFAEMEGDDTSVALVRFVDGTVGTMVESFLMKSLTTASGPELHTLRIDGDLGSLVTRAGRTIELYSEHPAYAADGPRQHTFVVPEEDTFRVEIAHFLECIRTGAEPLTSGRSQRRPLELVLAAYRSMESGRPVDV